MVKEAEFGAPVGFSFAAFWRLDDETDEGMCVSLRFLLASLPSTDSDGSKKLVNSSTHLEHWLWLVAWEPIV